MKTPDLENPGVQANAASASPPALPSPFQWLLLGLTLVGLLGCLLLWQRLSVVQEQLARQSAETLSQSSDALSRARQAEESARDAVAKQALFDARLSELALQRGQLEELMRSLSRSRDENLILDLESSVRLAQQQALLAGSVEPLIVALKTADQRIGKSPQPKLAPVQKAIIRDLDRLKVATVADTPVLLAKLEEVLRLVDDLPLINQTPLTTSKTKAVSKGQSLAQLAWWAHWWESAWDSLHGLVRVSKIQHPEAMLLTPDQAYFIRENLKLCVLNARLGILARQHAAARGDLITAKASVAKYFDGQSRTTQSMMASLSEIQTQLKSVSIPAPEQTLLALTLAAAGR